MKVQINYNLGTNEFPETPYREGDVKNVPDALGHLLLQRGLATEIVDVKAVPPVDLKTSIEIPPADVLAKDTGTPDGPAVKQKPKGGK